MLPDPTAQPSLMTLLEKVGTFTSPSLQTFAALLTGLVAATGKRTVTGMLTAAGLSRTWSHDRAHAFFSRAAWNPEILGWSVTDRHTGAEDKLAQIDVSITCRTSNVDLGIPGVPPALATGRE